VRPINRQERVAAMVRGKGLGPAGGSAQFAAQTAQISSGLITNPGHDYPGSSVSLSTRSGRGPQQQAAFSRRSVIAASLNLRLKRKQKAPV